MLDKIKLKQEVERSIRETVEPLIGSLADMAVSMTDAMPEDTPEAIREEIARGMFPHAFEDAKSKVAEAKSKVAEWAQNPEVMKKVLMDFEKKAAAKTDVQEEINNAGTDK